MSITENEKDRYGTFITGIAYTGIIGIILLLLCFLIDETWLDHSITYIIVVVLCITFFISGLKRVKLKDVGILVKFGKRDFDKIFTEGIWWIFPLWSFKQQPHFDRFNESEKIEMTFITSDEIPLEIEVKYYWQSKDLKDFDNKYSPSYLKDKLAHELGVFIRSRKAVELLSDAGISDYVMKKYLINAGERIGITLSDVFPNINYEAQYNAVVSEYQRKYKALKFQLDEMLQNIHIKGEDMKLYETQITNYIKVLGVSPNDALNFIKVYKNNVEMNDKTYNVNVQDINKILDAAVSIIMNKNEK